MRYREMAPELQRLAQPGQTVFGDLLVDEDVEGSFRVNYGSANDVAPFAQPGRAGRERQMQRLVQQQPHREDEDDWFSNRRRDDERPRRQQQQQRRPPSRNAPVDYRSSGPVLDAQYYDHHKPAPRQPAPRPSYAPLPLPPRPIQSDGAPAGRRSGPSRGYPAPHEISTGYRHTRHTRHASPQLGAPERGPGLSIRGAAQRREEQERNEHAGGRYRRREGGRELDRERREWVADWARENAHDRREGKRNGYHNDHRRY